MSADVASLLFVLPEKTVKTNFSVCLYAPLVFTRECVSRLGAQLPGPFFVYAGPGVKGHGCTVPCVFIATGSAASRGGCSAAANKLSHRAAGPSARS